MTGGRSHGDRKEQQPATSIWRLSATALVPLAALAAVGGGCFQPGFGDGEAPGPDALSIPIDLFRQDGGGGGDGDGLRCPPMRATRELTFTFTTVPLGGRFAPRNVGAVWIERASGEFVRTLEEWGGMRAKWLTNWQSASSGNTVDAVTGATLDRHVTHAARWDLKDAHGCDVPDGPHVLRVELTDRSGTGAVESVAFDKSDAPVSLAPADSGPFTEMQLILE